MVWALSVHTGGLTLVQGRERHGRPLDVPCRSAGPGESKSPRGQAGRQAGPHASVGVEFLIYPIGHSEVVHRFSRYLGATSCSRTQLGVSPASHGRVAVELGESVAADW